jgi:hypothetical protein
MGEAIEAAASRCIARLGTQLVPAAHPRGTSTFQALSTKRRISAANQGSRKNVNWGQKAPFCREGLIWWKKALLLLLLLLLLPIRLLLLLLLLPLLPILLLLLLLLLLLALLLLPQVSGGKGRDTVGQSQSGS